MKKARVLNVLSLVFNVAIIGAVVYVFVAMLMKDVLNSVLFFTVLANLLVALAALVCVPCNIVGIAKQKRLPVGAYAFKLVGVASVGVVFLVTTVLFPLLGKGSIADQYGNFSFERPEFFLHLIVPAASMVSFIFFDHTERAKFSVTILSIIPVLLYSGFYIANYFVKFVAAKVTEGADPTYDWYGLVTEGKEFIGILTAVGIVVSAFVLAAILYLLNRGLHKAFFGRTSAPAEEPVKVTYPQEETAPAEEKEEPEVQEEPVAEEEPEPELEEALEESAEPEEPVEEPEEEKKPVKTVYARRVEPVAEENKPAEQKEEAPAKKPAPVKKPAPAKEETKKAPAKKPEPVKKAPAAKPAEKPVEEKPAPAKKPAEKPAPAVKAEPAKKAAPAKKPAEKPAPAKEESSNQTKVYHLTKRKEDGMWAITFVGGQKAVKLFKTKKEAEAALKVLTENQGATALIRNSKGAKAGKFASSIKASEDEKK